MGQFITFYKLQGKNKWKNVLMFLTRVKQILRKLSFTGDMFKAPACLRAKGEPQVSRLCTGILSVILGASFIYMLILKLTQLLNTELIQFTKTYETQQNLSAPAFENISISIAPSWENYVDWAAALFVEAKLVVKGNGTGAGGGGGGGVGGGGGGEQVVGLEMEKCRVEDWGEFRKVFQVFVMGQNICIKNPNQVKLQGTNPNQNIQYLQIQITQCNSPNNPNPQIPCLQPQNFPKYLSNLTKHKFNFYSLYIKDTSINAKKRDPIQEHLTLDYKMFFDEGSWKRLDVYLGRYRVETDRSIWPIYQDVEIRQGYFISQSTVTKIPKKIDKFYSQNNIFGLITLQMTTQKIKYIRKIGKIDEIISYAGGLLGLILSFFTCFVYSYNKFSYELLVAQSSFNYEESGEKVRVKHFGVFMYVKFQVYDWVRSMFGRGPKWRDCEMIYQTKDQANLFLDVRYLFRKMRLINLGVQHLITQNQQKMVYLTQAPSLSQVIQRKTHLQYYDSIIQNNLALNIQDIKTHEFRVNNLVTQLAGGTLNTFIMPTQTYQLTSPVTFTIVQNQQTMKLRREFLENLGIKEEIVLKAMACFQEEYWEMMGLDLDEDLEEVQKKYAMAYLRYEEAGRDDIVEKIPLKILFRLSRCIGMMKAKRLATIHEQPQIIQQQKDRHQRQEYQLYKQSQKFNFKSKSSNPNQNNELQPQPQPQQPYQSHQSHQSHQFHQLHQPHQFHQQKSQKQSYFIKSKEQQQEKQQQQQEQYHGKGRQWQSQRPGLELYNWKEWYEDRISEK